MKFAVLAGSFAICAANEWAAANEVGYGGIFMPPRARPAGNPHLYCGNRPAYLPSRNQCSLQAFLNRGYEPNLDPVPDALRDHLQVPVVLLRHDNLPAAEISSRSFKDCRM